MQGLDVLLVLHSSVHALAYSDDIVITAPTATAMRKLYWRFAIDMLVNITCRLMLVKTKCT
jgi:hypothetical protein